jgi:hypothetical protein
MATTLYLRPNFSFQIPSSAGGASWAAAIQARATVNLTDDFQSGLGAWSGKPGWAATWTLDRSGSVQPGRLALYSPSIPLTDYRLEFQGQIDAKALGFVFRATGTNNYYAAKLAVVKPGPLPSVALVRYAVIDGHEGPKTQTPLAIHLRGDTLYKLLVTVQGESFSVSVNGQSVDAWSDNRLKSGGVGFFADKGEISHLRAVHVVDNEDFLGWLCSQVSQWTADRRRIGVSHE